MKKTHIIPSMIVVRLQHQSFICQSVTGTKGNAGIGYGGGSKNNTDEVRTKESGNVWDEEW